MYMSVASPWSPRHEMTWHWGNIFQWEVNNWCILYITKYILVFNIFWRPRFVSHKRGSLFLFAGIVWVCEGILCLEAFFKISHLRNIPGWEYLYYLHLGASYVPYIASNRQCCKMLGVLHRQKLYHISKWSIWWNDSQYTLSIDTTFIAYKQ